MRRKKIVPTGNRLKQIPRQWRQLSPRHLLAVKPWKRLGRWIVWNISPKRRRIKYLIKRLIPLEPSTSPEVKKLRDEVFALTCLRLKRRKEQRNLLELLNSANRPAGFEQLFLSAIYPQILKRNLTIIPLATEATHRLDVEIGYLGYDEDYFFWVFEIDGTAKADLGAPFVPQQALRTDKKFVIYRLNVAGLVKGQNRDPLQWIISSQTHFNNILTDLKKRNYKVTAASIPRFEQERLLLLRRMALNELKRRRFRS